MTNALKVRTDQMKKLVDLHGLNETTAANKIGVGRQTFRRAMAGENVSSAFAAGAVLAFEVPFQNLFYAVRLDTPVAA